MDLEALAANKKAVEGKLVPNKMPEVSSIKEIAANTSEAVEGKQVPSKMQGVTSTSNLPRIPETQIGTPGSGASCKKDTAPSRLINVTAAGGSAAEANPSLKIRAATTRQKVVQPDPRARGRGQGGHSSPDLQGEGRPQVPQGLQPCFPRPPHHTQGPQVLESARV